MEKKEFKGRNKGKARRTYAKRNDDKVVRDSKTVDNDAAWYTSNGQLTKDVASFSFNTPLGHGLQINGIGTSSQLKYNLRLPGIMAIATVPTVGYSDSAISPVNVAAKNIYSYVRHANSGHSNYDPADLMFYLLSMDSIYTYWAYLIRIYGVAQLFSKVNRYVGDALIRAMGADPYSVRSNLADLRAYINSFAIRASGFAVPKTMSYFVRHNWMYSNIYKDEDTSKAQMYMYVPAFLHKYTVDAETGAGKLEATPVAVSFSSSISGLNLRTVAALQTLGDTFLNAVVEQEDIGIMSGDILKAYGPENLWKLDPLPENYVVMPTFSEEMLAQIHNTDFAGAIPVIRTGNSLTVSTKSLDYIQDTSVGSGNIICKPTFRYASHLWHDRILDFWHEAPDPDVVLVGTRNKLSGSAIVTDDPNDRAAEVGGCGSEIALCAFIITYDTNNALSVNRYYYSDAGNSAQGIGDLSRFNEYPIYYKINAMDGAITEVIGEIDTCTVMTQWENEQIHLAAMLSLFGVPYVK